MLGEAFWGGKFSWGVMLDGVLGALVLGGTYLVLYLVSWGKWVGDGDWILAAAIGVAIGSPWLALLILFLANFLAMVVSLPVIVRRKQGVKKKVVKTHKKKGIFEMTLVRKTRAIDVRIPFGPFLVAAYIIVFAASDFCFDMLAL